MNAMPMIERCTLGQGGGDGYLRELRDLADHARAVFGPEFVVALARSDYTAVVVRENLAEPTRQEWQA